VDHRSRAIRAAVESADMVELAMALIEPDHAGGLPVATSAGFPCPGCQRRSWVLHGARARCLDDVVWSCSSCGASTRWALARRVLEDAAALERFAAFSGVAA
jgi:hypothetical protein